MGSLPSRKDSFSSGLRSTDIYCLLNFTYSVQSYQAKFRNVKSVFWEIKIFVVYELIIDPIRKHTFRVLFPVR